jgi:glycosyltransferase involved in cell wall biosynthesis
MPAVRAGGESASDSLVSVVMAAHNGARHISDAIESVLAQTHRKIELIVVDDCSTDATPQIVEEFAGVDPDRVILIRQRVNAGPCRARSLGFARARGEFFCWIDQDDLWMPTKVEEQLAVMRESPNVGLRYTYFDAFDDNTGRTIPWPDGRRDHEGDVLGRLFVEGCFIGSITAMIRRGALETRGLRIRTADFSIGDDYYLWLGIALDWQVARIPRVLARYRRHPANESMRLARRNVDLWRVRLLREFLDEYPDAKRRLGRCRRTAFARHYLLAARYAFRHQRVGQALVLAGRSVAADPLMPLRRARGMPARRGMRGARRQVANVLRFGNARRR